MSIHEIGHIAPAGHKAEQILTPNAFSVNSLKLLKI